VRPDMAPGCPESAWDPAFPRFLWYVARFRGNRRPELVARLARLGDEKRTITLRSQREVRGFVESVG